MWSNSTVEMMSAGAATSRVSKWVGDAARDRDERTFGDVLNVALVAEASVIARVREATGAGETQGADSLGELPRGRVRVAVDHFGGQRQRGVRELQDERGQAKRGWRMAGGRRERSGGEARMRSALKLRWMKRAESGGCGWRCDGDGDGDAGCGTRRGRGETEARCVAHAD